MKKFSFFMISALIMPCLGSCFVKVKMPEIVPDSDSEEAVDDMQEDEETGGDELFDGPCPPRRITFQAEEMDLDEGFERGTSEDPGVGGFIAVREARSGEAFAELEIPCEDDWLLWGLMRWESGDSDSFYWAWDDPGGRTVWNVFQCVAPGDPGWYWDRASVSPDLPPCHLISEDPAVTHLEGGRHTFHLQGREAGAAAAEFVLTNDPDWEP